MNLKLAKCLFLGLTHRNTKVHCCYDYPGKSVHPQFAVINTSGNCESSAPLFYINVKNAFILMLPHIID